MTHEITSQPTLEGYEFLKETYSQKDSKEKREIFSIVIPTLGISWRNRSRILLNAIEQAAKQSSEAVK